MSAKPRFLLLGGTGFIGRNLVAYLIRNDLASKIRIADKAIPQTAYLNKEFEQFFANPIVEFKQANLVNPAHIQRALDDPSGKYDFVINLAAETRYGQSEEVYEQMVHQLSVNCARAIVTHEPQRYIEVSTAQVYDADKKASKETSKIDPWTKLARAKLKAENEIKNIQGLPWIIVRPAITYGPGDVNGLMPRIIVGATYTKTRDTMKMLWGGDFRINTVHVRDVAKALYHLCLNGPIHEIYNLADSNDTNQKKLNTILEQIYGIKTDFYNSIISNLARTQLKSVAETANENHMSPWSDMCRDANILNTPLSPYLDIELLYNNPLSVDGTKICGTGFTYDHPNVTKDLVLESIHYYQEMKVFPPVNGVGAASGASTSS